MAVISIAFKDDTPMWRCWLTAADTKGEWIFTLHQQYAFCISGHARVHECLSVFFSMQPLDYKGTN